MVLASYILGLASFPVLGFLLLGFPVNLMYNKKRLSEAGLVGLLILSKKKGPWLLSHRLPTTVSLYTKQLLKDKVATDNRTDPDYIHWGYLAKRYNRPAFMKAFETLLYESNQTYRPYLLDVFCKTCYTNYRFYLPRRCSCRLDCDVFDLEIVDDNFIPVGTIGIRDNQPDKSRMFIQMWNAETDTYQRADIKELWIGDEPGIDCNFVVTKLLLLLANEEFVTNNLVIRIVGKPDLNINTMRIINTYKLTQAAQ